MSIFAPVDPSQIDWFKPAHDGYPDALAAGDTPDVLRDVCGSASREFPAHLWIEPNRWAEKAKENDQYKTWPANHLDRFTNQNPNHFCTCESLGAGFVIARNRQRGISLPEGPKAGVRLAESAEFDSVWPSSMSVYAEANPREWGGASTRQVLDIAIRRGFLPDATQPREYGFKHTLTGTTGKGGINQSRGSWVPLSRFPEGWQETAKNFRIQEVIFPESGEQVVCLILHGYSVHVGRKGHAIPYTFWNDEKKVMGYHDSYDVIRYDSWSTVRGCASGSYAIVSVTTPDNWRQPAGTSV